jgi:hypothetical protein
MSRLAEFRRLEQQVAAQFAKLGALKGSSELQKEIQFETNLRDLLAEYGFILRDVINLLDPQAGRREWPLFWRQTAALLALRKSLRASFVSTFSKCFRWFSCCFCPLREQKKLPLQIVRLTYQIEFVGNCFTKLGSIHLRLAKNL